MPYLTKSQLQQKIRDGESMGIPRATTYQQLKTKGYTFEGEPAALGPTPESSGGVLGYFKATMMNALGEIGAVAGGVKHYAMNPGEIVPDALGAGRDTVEGLTRAVVGAGEGLYKTATGNTPPVYNPDGSVTYPESGMTPNMEVTKSLLDSGAQALRHPLQTFRDHPLQTAATVAPVFGAVGRAASAGKFGVKAQKASQAMQGVKTAVKGAVKKVPSEILGNVTGAGGGATRMASNVDNFSSAFHEGMRGDPLEQARILAADAQRGLGELKKRRSAEYLKTNEAMRSIMEPMDDAPVRQLLSDTMNEFRITETEKGLLDSMKNMTDEQSVQHLNSLMNRPEGGGALSPLVKAGIGEGPTASKIGKAINYVENWDDFTPDGMDRLQQALNSIDPKPGSRESAFITKLKRGVQGVVKEKYPEYSKMLSAYHDASDQIEELQAAIGARDNVNIEATVRKISQSMKTGNQGHEIRNAVLAELEQATGVKIRERVAGMAMNQVMPRGLAGVGAGLGTVAVVGQLISPTFLIGLAMSSPRVVGEVLSAMGVAKKFVAPIYSKLKAIVPPSHSLSVGAGLEAVEDATNPE